MAGAQPGGAQQGELVESGARTRQTDPWLLWDSTPGVGGFTLNLSVGLDLAGNGTWG